MARGEAALWEAWLQGWWDQDYSWAGLAKKPLGANGDLTHGGLHDDMDLQAYWRRDPETGVAWDDAAMREAGELVTGPDGRDWHIAHVPLHWRDGTPAKEAWDQEALDKLAEIIRQRIAAATETATNDECLPLGPDGRAQLRGVVLRTAPADPAGEGQAVHAVCIQSLLHWAPARGQAYGPGFRCDQAYFDGPGGFVEARFGGACRFDDAIFSDFTSFKDARFPRGVTFDGASFVEMAVFEFALFGSDAAPEALAGKTSFAAAAFHKEAIFSDTSFDHEASFYRATFAAAALFLRTTFRREASFGGRGFADDVIFDGVTFWRGARFDAVKFAAYASFIDARFLGAGSALFHACRFDNVVAFEGAQFGKPVAFTSSSFARLASFQDIKWPRQAKDWHGMFDQAVFKDVANFRKAGLRCFAAFDGAAFHGGLQLDAPDDATANHTYRDERKLAEALPDHEAGLRQLEGGCRVLKQAMEKSANKTREQMFYAFELIARRRQRATPRWERAASWLYESVADYGRSIGKPLVWLVGLVPAFALAYAALALAFRADQLGGMPGLGLLVETLGLSAQRVFPFGPWALTPAQMSTSPIQAALLGRSDSLLAFTVRMLGTVQSLLAIILAFLAGLAIRRRFQIN